MRYIQKLMAVILALLLLFAPDMARGDVAESTEASTDAAENAQLFPETAGESAATGAPTTGSDPWGLQVYFLDLGRVDGILICCEGEYSFIDVGMPADAPPAIRYLKALGVDHLDSYIASHGHTDHIGGASRIIHEFKPKKIYMNRPQTLDAILECGDPSEAEDVMACETVVLKAGDTFNIGGARVKCLGPQAIRECAIDNQKENYNSLILRMDYAIHSFLFTGDTMNRCLTEANGVFPGELQVDVFKNPHHNGAHDESVIDLIRPKMTVFCTDNKDQPTEKYLQILKSAGSDIYITGSDHQGNIAIVCNKADMDVRLGYLVQSIELAPIPDMYVGQICALKGTVEPSEYARASWLNLKCPNSNVVKLEGGKVTAVGEGRATITAAALNGLTASVEVQVYSAVVELEQSQLNLAIGEKRQLRGRLLPEKVKGLSGEWISEDESIATCSAKGQVTGVSPGTTRIIARLSNGAEAVCTVTVSGHRIEGISLDRKTATMTVGDSLSLTATLDPVGAGDAQLEWASSDEKILWVDHLGNVTAVGRGTAKIGVRAAGSDKVAVCTIKVE